ncbi:MAG: EVE domain-containing protein [Geminicoccaceae bacterium]
MPHWLFKTEPGDYSWEDLVADGETEWDGVKNHQAAANMREMKVGERAFFYRSIKDPAVLGVMEVSREAYPDPDDSQGKFVRVDVKPVAKLCEPVSLAAIKGEAKLSHIALVRQSRLSVMPIDDEAWSLILSMGGGLED